MRVAHQCYRKAQAQAFLSHALETQRLPERVPPLRLQPLTEVPVRRSLQPYLATFLPQARPIPTSHRL